MQECIEEILQNYDRKNIAIVSHGAAIRFLLLKWCNFNYDNNTFYYEGKVVFHGQLESPSILKLTFENNSIISIKRI